MEASVNEAELSTLERVAALPLDALIGAINLLDALPDVIRAMLTALLLVALLAFFERRIPVNEFQYGQSFRKTAMIMLLLLPLCVWLFPASRMVVFVEELPEREAATLGAWRFLVGLWAAGALVALGAWLRQLLRSRSAASGYATIEEDKLRARLAHWQRRLGLEDELRFLESPGEQPLLLLGGHELALPAAARHWPGNLQDLVMIVNLCHLKRGHRPWHLLAQLVSAVYWPIPFVRAMHRRLLDDFRASADELGESCYQDRLGYARTLKQLDQRLAPPANRKSLPEKVGTRAGSVAVAIQTQLQGLLAPVATPHWAIDHLLVARDSEAPLKWTDPYDKVVLFVGQAVFFAFLLTGVTLKERPPEVEQDYQFPFELFWKEHFHRNLELQEKTLPPKDAP
ncbi:MAG: M56 family metallopeptidase [Pseudomonadota bacterium]